MIVGFEIEIINIQAKFKLSQNRPIEDQRRVSHELGRSNNQAAVAIATLMQQNSSAEF